MKGSMTKEASTIYLELLPSPLRENHSQVIHVVPDDFWAAMAVVKYFNFESDPYLAFPNSYSIVSRATSSKVGVNFPQAAMNLWDSVLQRDTRSCKFK